VQKILDEVKWTYQEPMVRELAGIISLTTFKITSQRLENFSRPQISDIHTFSTFLNEILFIIWYYNGIIIKF
jgi:hypothetical protein